MSALPPEHPQMQADAAERLAVDGRADEAAERWHAILAGHGELGITLLRIRAHRQFRRSNWEAAELLYGLLAQARPSYRFLCKRPAWCRRHSAQFAAEHMTPAHRARVLDRLRPAIPEAADLDTTVGPAGLNSIRTFRHSVLDGAGNVIETVFEKCFVGTEIRGFTRTGLIFGRFEAKALMAPRYYGTLRIGPFRSSLHRFVSGVRPTVAEWPEIKQEVVRHLWRHTQGDGLTGALAHTRWHNLVERLRCPGVPAYTLLWWPAGSAREWSRMACGWTYADAIAPHVAPAVLERLRRHRAAIAERLRRLPTFVMHGDLHQGNVLYDRKAGVISVIDWDRWTIEPVGAGMPVDLAAGEAQMPAADMLRPEHAGAVSPPLDAMRLAAVMWDLRASFKDRLFDRLQPLAELALHYSRP